MAKQKGSIVSVAVAAAIVVLGGFCAYGAKKKMVGHSKECVSRNKAIQIIKNSETGLGDDEAKVLRVLKKFYTNAHFTHISDGTRELSIQKKKIYLTYDEATGKIIDVTAPLESGQDLPALLRGHPEVPLDELKRYQPVRKEIIPEIPNGGRSPGGHTMGQSG